MKRAIVVTGFIFLGIAAQAQMRQIQRYEKERSGSEDYFTVIPMKEYGMLMVEDDDHSGGKEDNWTLHGLSTSLEETWVESLPINYKFEFRAYEQIDKYLYLMFEESDRTVANYVVVSIDILSGNIESYEIKNEIEFELAYIAGLQDQLILGGYVRQSPTLLSYKIGESVFSVVPGYFKDKSDIIDLRANDRDTYNILTMEKNYTGYFLRIRTYSFDSEILFEKEIMLDRNYQLIDGYSLGFVDGNMAIAGTYGSTNSNYVQGLFFALVTPGGQENGIKYHDLSAFEHFFDYTSPKRAVRLEEKAEDYSSKGKELKVGVRLQMNNLNIPKDGVYVLSSDVYDPHYEGDVRDRYFYDPFYFMNDVRYLPAGRYRNSRYPYDSRMYEQTVKYDFLSGFAVALNSKGDVLWDNSIVVDDREAYSLHPIVETYAGPDSLHMVYKYENDIVHQAFGYDSETTERKFSPIQMRSETDDLRNSDEEIGEAGFWYGNFFYVWGYQRINDRAVHGSDGKREVIYINKVAIGNSN